MININAKNIIFHDRKLSYNKMSSLDWLFEGQPKFKVDDIVRISDWPAYTGIVRSVKEHNSPSRFNHEYMVEVLPTGMEDGTVEWDTTHVQYYEDELEMSSDDNLPEQLSVMDLEFKRPLLR